MSRAYRLNAAGAAFLCFATVLLSALVAAPSWGVGPTSDPIQAQVQAAAAAAGAGFNTGVAVLDLRTGKYYGAGDDQAEFPTESVVKVMIAARILAEGRMSGSVEQTAYKMITQSDDHSATALYGGVGGDALIDWVKAYFKLPDLGSRPIRTGWWGTTRITAKGMVRLYAAIRKDPRLGPWITNAMAHAQRIASDGLNQWFGIPSAAKDWAVKQGWGHDGPDKSRSYFNSTGYVSGYSFAVAILTGGPSWDAMPAALTRQAHALLPNGTLDSPAAHNPAAGKVFVQAKGNSVQITGTAKDPDAPTTSVPVTVYEGDTKVGAAKTDSSGAYAVSLQAQDGKHSYRIMAANIGKGTAPTSAAASAVAVNGAPSGKITAVKGSQGTITICGTEKDPNASQDSPPQFAVTVDGGDPVTGTASHSPFTYNVDGDAGEHTVTVAFVHRGGGKNVGAGTWTVTVPDPPPPLAEPESGTERIVLIGASAAGVAVVVGIGVALFAWHRRRGATSTARHRA